MATTLRPISSESDGNNGQRVPLSLVKDLPATALDAAAQAKLAKADGAVQTAEAEAIAATKAAERFTDAEKADVGTIGDKVDQADQADLTGATGWPYVQNGEITVLSDDDARALIGGTPLGSTEHPVWAAVDPIVGEVDPDATVTRDLSAFVTADQPVTYEVVGTPDGVTLDGAVATVDFVNIHDDAVGFRASYAGGGSAVVLVPRTVTAPPNAAISFPYDEGFDALVSGETIEDADPRWQRVSGTGDLLRSTDEGRISVRSSDAVVQAAQVDSPHALFRFDMKWASGKSGGVRVGCDAAGVGGVHVRGRHTTNIFASAPGLATVNLPQTFGADWVQVVVAPDDQGSVEIRIEDGSGGVLVDFGALAYDAAALGPFIAFDAGDSAMYYDRVRITAL